MSGVSMTRAESARHATGVVPIVVVAYRDGGAMPLCRHREDLRILAMVRGLDDAAVLRR